MTKETYLRQLHHKRPACTEKRPAHMTKKPTYNTYIIRDLGRHLLQNAVYRSPYTCGHPYHLEGERETHTERMRETEREREREKEREKERERRERDRRTGGWGHEVCVCVLVKISWFVRPCARMAVCACRPRARMVVTGMHTHIHSITRG